MRGMAFEVAAASQPSLLLEPNNNNNNNNKLKEGSFGSNNNEPISVLDTRRSPSPFTSTSTFSSSFNGGATTTTTTNTTPSLGVADNPQKWPGSVPQEMGISGYVSNFSGNVDNGRKDDWPELQPIPAEFELQQQRCGVGLNSGD